MHAFNLTALVTTLALTLYTVMFVRTGAARRRSGLAAPAVVGDEMFERHYRVQMNTLEVLPVFLVSLWLFTLYWGQFVAAALGAIWLVGRTIYMLSYVSDPRTRTLGFAIQAAPTAILLLGAIAGAVRALVVLGA